jgi:nucleoid-associated protein YgaU
MSANTATAPSTNGTATAPAWMSPGSLAGSTTPVKAYIINKDKDKEGSKRIYCMFNPKEYAFTKQNSWKQGDTKGTDVPQMEFSSGQPATLTLQLFFDTYEIKKDVREVYTNALWELMLVDQDLRNPKSDKSRPPVVRFHWGTAWSFDAVITRMSQKFTLFLDNGTPVRATVDVTFQQVTDSRRLGRQNPTSGSVDSTRLWTVQEGDTLAWIAYLNYSDPTQWRRIADANRLARVRHLRPGSVLEIPGV